MAELGSTVASFYWQLTSVINEDIPLDARGKPVEFERYVDYFLDRRTQFQGDLAKPLKAMAVATYLDAIAAGREPRAAIRTASHKASALTRRSKALQENGLGDTPLTKLDVDLTSGTWDVRDCVEALLLEHGAPLADYLLNHVAIRPVLTPLSPWATALSDYLESRSEGDMDASTRRLESLRSTSSRLLSVEPGTGWWDRVSDRIEGASDIVSAWRRASKVDPRAALKPLVREVMALNRLVPSAVFLATSTILYAWIVWQGITQIQHAWHVVALVGSLAAFIWLADALTYAVHLERDGWGDSPETRSFQDHHDFPHEVALWTLRRSVGAVGHGILILMVLLALAQPHFTIAVGAGTSLMAFLFATQTHRWAHTPEALVPRWVRLLQKSRLILPIQTHAEHHDHLDRSWGIFNGWSNALFDSIGYHKKYAKLRGLLLRSAKPLWESQLAARDNALSREAFDRA